MMIGGIRGCSVYTLEKRRRGAVNVQHHQEPTRRTSHTHQAWRPYRLGNALVPLAAVGTLCHLNHSNP